MIKEERTILRDKILYLFQLHKIMFIRNNKPYIIINDKFTSTIDSNIELKELYNLYISEYSSIDEALYCLRNSDDKDNHICPICKNNSLYNISKYRYGLTCGSINCIESIANSKEAKEKAKATSNKNFGVDHPMKNKEHVKKIESIMKEKYGVEHPLELKEFKKKAEETTLAHYGVKSPLQSKEVLDKLKSTNLERYGVENPFSSEEIKEKIKHTNLERYGFESPMQNKDIVQKGINTSIEKYGVNNVSQLHISNYDIWIDDNKFREYILLEYDKSNHDLFMEPLYKFFNIDKSTLKHKLKELDLYKLINIKDSKLEKDFSTFLESNNIKYISHCRNILYDEDKHSYKEIDFLLKDYSIGIEINDISTHNSINPNSISYKDSLYHQHKSILATSNNIRLIHLWEWELSNNSIWNRVSKWILNLLDQSNKTIVKDNYIIKEIDDSSKEYISFVDMYNISIYDDIQSDKQYGLYYNNELVQVLSCKCIDSKEYKWKIINFITKFSYSIDHRLLLDYFFNHNKVDSLIVECDYSKFSGNTYRSSLGFDLISITRPNEIYCDYSLKYSNSKVNDKYMTFYDSGRLVYLYSNIR